MSDRYRDARCEPPLEELLTDPIVGLLLERDGIDPAVLRSYLDSIRKKLQRARSEAASESAPAPVIVLWPAQERPGLGWL
jgi:hypothetical protein